MKCSYLFHFLVEVNIEQSLCLTGCQCKHAAVPEKNRRLHAMRDSVTTSFDICVLVFPATGHF